MTAGLLSPASRRNSSCPPGRVERAVGQQGRQGRHGRTVAGRQQRPRRLPAHPCVGVAPPLPHRLPLVLVALAAKDVGGGGPLRRLRVVQSRRQDEVGLAVRGQRQQRGQRLVLDLSVVGIGQVVQQDGHGVGRGASGQQPRRHHRRQWGRPIDFLQKLLGPAGDLHVVGASRRPDQRRGPAADLPQRHGGLLAVVEVVS